MLKGQLFLKTKTPNYKKYTHIREMVADAANNFGNTTYLKYINADKSIGELSFSDFADMVKALGTYLLELPSVKRIAVYSENRYEWIVSYITSLSCGIVVVPIDKELQFEQAEKFISLAEVDTIVFSSQFEKSIANIAESGCGIKNYICLDPTENPVFTTLESCISNGRERLENGSLAYSKLRTDPSKMAEIIFTSGTTGTSKGVMLSESNLLACIYASANTVDIHFGDTILSVLPYHHTYEASCGFLTPLTIGCTVCINNSLKYVLKNLKLFQPTAMVLVPLFVTTIYKKINDEIRKKGKEKLVKNSISVTRLTRRAGIDLRRIVFAEVHKSLGGRLRNIICGGAALDPEIVRRFDELGITVAQGYGITECSPLVAVTPYAKVKPESVGLPIEGSTVKIIGFDDDGDEADIPVGDIGEICVKGPHVMLGYYKNPEATANAFSKEGYFKTGDYGCLDNDGYIYITGRKKNIIILDNGKNIYPEEIEEYLYRCDLIEECVVASRIIDGEELLSAIIYPCYSRFEGKEDQAIKDEIKKAVMDINRSLPSFKQIRNIEIKKTEFEKTTTKKIIRHKI